MIVILSVGDLSHHSWFSFLVFFRSHGALHLHLSLPDGAAPLGLSVSGLSPTNGENPFLSTRLWRRGWGGGGGRWRTCHRATASSQASLIQQKSSVCSTWDCSAYQHTHTHTHTHTQTHTHARAHARKTTHAHTQTNPRIHTHTDTHTQTHTCKHTHTTKQRLLALCGCFTEILKPLKEIPYLWLPPNSTSWH